MSRAIKARRIKNIYLATGLAIAFQDTAESSTAFVAIAHLDQGTPGCYLRRIIDCRGMSGPKTADEPVTLHRGTLSAPAGPALDVTTDLGLPSEPVASCC